MEVGSANDEHDIHQLYKASVRGYEATLKTLIGRCPEILRQVPVLTSSGETPLHISAALGHVKFTKRLLRLKPVLLTELDSFGNSPLHLASAEGHTRIVKELLKANSNVCLVADQNGRIPLHLAAIKGRVAVIRQLIRKKPETITERLSGETVLHLCVKYNHLDALKLLMASITDEVFLNSTDRRGKTIFLLSVMLKHFQVPRIRVDINSLVTVLETQHSLNGSGTENNFQGQASLGRTDTIQSTQSNSNTTRKPINSKRFPGSLQSRLNKFLGYKSDQYEETRGHLIVVATLIAQMSFQVATNPPGGYWQTDSHNADGCPEERCRAGTSILSYSGKNDYLMFIASSTLSFVASLSIILLLISGVPLKNKVFVWILVIGMWSTVILMAATYIFSIRLVQVHNEQALYNIFSYAPMLLGALIFSLVLVHSFRLGKWLMWDKKLLIRIFVFLYSLAKKLTNWINNGMPRESQRDPGNAV